MADRPAVKPLGSERFVDWGDYVDGEPHTLWRGPRSEGYHFEQDVEKARGAFLSYASRRGLVTHTETDRDEGKWLIVQARPRREFVAAPEVPEPRSAKPRAKRPNAVDKSTAGA